jgi:hypothetical protein
MNKFTILFFITFLGINSCKSQTKSSSKIIHNKDFNWTITIPENFVSMNENEWNKAQQKGKDAIEKTLGEEIIDQTTTIFIFKNEQFNNFEANYQPYDIEIDGNYLETYKEVNEMLYQTFETQIPKAKLDSISSIQKISGLEFQRFDITVDLPNGIKMTTIGFSRLFDKKEFTLNITALDEKIEKKMLDSFLNSKFE